MNSEITMPTYEYECSACGQRVEKFQKMSDAPLLNCPECGGPMRRLIGTGAGVIFKGSGFYQTDYANSNRSSATPCGRGQTCCGREQRCESPPCHE